MSRDLRFLGGSISFVGSVASVGAVQAAEMPSDVAAAEAGPEEVTVTGVRSLIGDKVPSNLQNAAQSIDVVPQQLIQEQGATRLADALRNVPGITMNAGEGTARGDSVNLRGFTAFNDFFLDGIRDAAVYTRDTFDIESYEVLKGPSAVVFGRGSTGGVINQVTKAPQLEPFYNAAMEGGTNNEGRGTIDLDMPIGDASAVRFNAMGERSDVAGRDFVTNRRWGAAPAVTFGLGAHDTAIFTFMHLEEDNVLDTGVPFIFGRPAPVPRGSFYGLNSDSATTNNSIVTGRYVHEFNDSVSVANTFRYADYNYDFHATAPHFQTAPIPGMPLSQILVGRDAPSSAGTQTNLTDQVDLHVRLATGSLKHDITSGFEIGRETLDLDRFLNPYNTNPNWVPVVPLLAPNPNQPLPMALPVTSHQATVANEFGAYVMDTIHVGDSLDVSGGGRLDSFSASSNQLTLTTGALSYLSHTDNVFSPRASIVYRPSEDHHVYFSYGTSFDPTAEAVTLSARTANLDPTTARTFEVGVKSSWAGGAFATSAALFRTEITNAQTNDPDHPTVIVLAGNQRVNGGEIGINGYVVKNLEVFAGYTYLDGKTTASGTPAYIGKALPNTARNALNLWSEYEFNDRLEFGAGLNWLGQRYADQAQSVVIPSYVIYNAMVAYRINDHIRMQINGYNLTDKLYYQNAYYNSAVENHVIPGAGRTVKLAISFTY